MADRAARLAALRAKAGKSTAAAPAPAEAEERTLKFRNYAAKDESLVAIPAPEEAGESSDAAPASSSSEPAGKKQKVEEKSAVTLALEAARAAAPLSNDVDANVLAPKKSNWDLKRDVAGQLEKLEKRTQRSIIVLLKERLEREASEDDEGLD
jgi:coiled-coil domain-containing protein 12